MSTGDLGGLFQQAQKMHHVMKGRKGHSREERQNRHPSQFKKSMSWRCHYKSKLQKMRELRG